MGNFKDLVKFNRYKSVESFNNASDITSSTISIVKLDENVMDIYLGRTKLTHSEFPELYDELKSFIDSFNIELNNIKKEFNSNSNDIISKQNLAANNIDKLKKDVSKLNTEVQHILMLILQLL